MFKEQVTACDKIQCLITNFNGFKRVLPNLEVSQEIWVSQSINKISFWMFVVSLFSQFDQKSCESATDDGTRDTFGGIVI